MLPKEYFAVCCKVTFFLDITSPQATGNTKDVRKRKILQSTDCGSSFTLVCYAFQNREFIILQNICLSLSHEEQFLKGWLAHQKAGQVTLYWQKYKLMLLFLLQELPKQILSPKGHLHVFKLKCPVNTLSFSACSYPDCLALPWARNDYSTEFQPKY